MIVAIVAIVAIVMLIAYYILHEMNINECINDGSMPGCAFATTGHMAFVFGLFLFCLAWIIYILLNTIEIIIIVMGKKYRTHNRLPFE